MSYSDAFGLEPSGQPVENAVRAFGFTMRGGYDVALARWFSLWLRASFGFADQHQSETAAGSVNEHTTNETWLGLAVPAIAQIAPHFFVGLGPSVSYDLQNQDVDSELEFRRTTLQVSALVGGWL